MIDANTFVIGHDPVFLTIISWYINAACPGTEDSRLTLASQFEVVVCVCDATSAKAESKQMNERAKIM